MEGRWGHAVLGWGQTIEGYLNTPAHLPLSYRSLRYVLDTFGFSYDQLGRLMRSNNSQDSCELIVEEHEGSWYDATITLLTDREGIMSETTFWFDDYSSPKLWLRTPGYKLVALPRNHAGSWVTASAVVSTRNGRFTHVRPEDLVLLDTRRK